MSGKAEDHVAIRNIYYMMAYAYGSITPGMNRDYGLEDFDHLLDLMSVILARALQSQGSVLKVGVSGAFAREPACY